MLDMPKSMAAAAKDDQISQIVVGLFEITVMDTKVLGRTAVLAAIFVSLSNKLPNL